MTYDKILGADTVSEDLPEKGNENWRSERFENWASKTTDFTVWSDDATGSPKDGYFVDASQSGGVVATLPVIATSDAVGGRTVTFYKTDATANAITITPPSGETIEGAATKTITTQYGKIKLIARTSTDWAQLVVS